ncbi:NAD(P)/FAD-dependent oxidoreductase [Alphaproteobacteria bacterium]|nr:NAD(P)/FAD-dependent oxidoreductase [Alphaproteobacteria bacterium]
MINKCDVVIIGAGAAGMMCAIEAGKRGRGVVLLDHAKKIGEKIRISGGGRCNFTNIYTDHKKFISSNPNFMISALSQYTHQNFIDLIQKYQISFHEKKLGQLFCDQSAQQIIEMLKMECEKANVLLLNNTNVESVSKSQRFITKTASTIYESDSLVIATGGLSIPKIGASKFGYDIAKQFGLNVIETFPALVPLTFSDDILKECKELSGLSVESQVSYKKTLFEEGVLFTHRGLSGPSILQISSYWKLGEHIQINLSPNKNIFSFLEEKKQISPKQDINSILSELLPKRLATMICNQLEISGRIADMSKKLISLIAEFINSWTIKPTGTEGYRTAEVTLGGVDTNELSSKTMMSKNNEGLYFIGEVVDVTGHLGGYNFQWAWSSGYVAGLNV